MTHCEERDRLFAGWPLVPLTPWWTGREVYEIVFGETQAHYPADKRGSAFANTALKVKPRKIPGEETE